MVTREHVLIARDRLLRNLNSAIGEAIQDYARVETAQAALVEVLLRIDFDKAYAVFFAIQNMRSRTKLIETLLELEFKDQFSVHWRSCAKFLLTLADFRNAAAHWHPMPIIVLSKDKSKSGELHGIAHPVRSSPYRPIVPNDFGPFKQDCVFAQRFLAELCDAIVQRASPLPDKFQKPITRQNLAALPLRRTAKAPQPRRQPSVAKLSPAQLRAKAAKEVREGKKK